jgi:uncharacterized protein
MIKKTVDAQPAITKKVLLDNLVLRINENIYLLMNLYSFRRKYISSDVFDILLSINEKRKANIELTSEEENCYCSLLNEKQTFDEKTIKLVDGEYRTQDHLSTRAPIKGITINLGYQCNLRCNYCYQNHYRTKDGNICEADIAFIQQFISNYNYPNTSTIEVVTISGGEPLININIETIKHIFDSFSDSKFHLFTNGINIMKYKDAIDFSKFSEIQVSLDGTDEVISSISSLAESNYFFQIVDGINYLTSLGCKVNIVCMLSKNIANWFDRFMDLLVGKHVFNVNGSVKMRLSIPNNHYANEVMDRNFLTLEDYFKIQNLIRTKKYDNVQLDLPYGIAKIAEFIRRPQNATKMGKVRVCKSTEKTPVVFGPNGKVYWCTCMEPEEGIIGNYYENIIYDEFINEISSRSVFSATRCTNCPVRYICASGCPLVLLCGNRDIGFSACNDLDDEEFIDNLERFIYENN